MPDCFCLPAKNPCVIALVLIALASQAWAEKERCVAGPNGEWRCGKNITDADAAPLPARTERSTPPILLIDPRRFGEADRAPSTPSSTSAQTTTASENPAEPSEPATAATSVAQSAPAAATETPSAAPVEPPEAVVQTAPTEEPTAANYDFSPPSTGFAVQLAVASSPRGFAALLAKLGERPKNYQQRQLKNGNWVLLLGNYSTIDAARSAIPKAIPGAFARNLADLSFN